VSASLEIVYNRKASVKATANRRLCRISTVRSRTSIERRPCRRSKTALQHIRRVAVAVAYQHGLEEGVTDDRADAWSDRRNLAAVAA
jgi:hypothetical protein